MDHCKLKAMEDTTARRIVQTLRRHGHSAFWVGGCVRDLLLGLTPKDYDVATSAIPEQVLACFPNGQRIGAHFGVILVSSVEVATFRSDHAYTDGRHPSAVRFESDPRQDALRRDFTINALFLDPISGEVHDWVGGRDDLKNGIIRAIGDPRLRFAEDHLRMLRAIRFAARFGYAIDPATLAAIRDAAPLIRRISAERIREELTRILTEGGARRAFELLDQTGLLQQILPEVAAMKGVDQPPQFHPEGDVWTHTLLMLEAMGKTNITQALGVLLHDVGKPPAFRRTDRIRFDGHAELGARMAAEIMTRLRYSAEQIRQVEALVANHMRFKDVPRMKESTLKRFLRLPRFDEHLELHRLDCLGSLRPPDTYEQTLARFQALPPEELTPPKLISGKDLIAAGFTPGPRFSQVLQAVEDAQLENRIHTPSEALELARGLFAERE